MQKMETIRFPSNSQPQAIEVSKNDVTLKEYLARFSGKGKVTNKIVDQLLMSGEKIPGVWLEPVAYGMPGQPLGKEITFRGWRYEVPKSHRELVDAVLVFQEGVKLTKTNRFRGEVTHVVKNYPRTSETWHYVDQELGIPQGAAVPSNDEKARRTWRRTENDHDEGQYLGALARGYDDWNGYDWRYVDADYVPDYGLRVAGLAQAEPRREIALPCETRELMKKLRKTQLDVPAVKELLEKLEAIKGFSKVNGIIAVRRIVENLETLQIKS